METIAERKAWTLVTHRDPDIDDSAAIFIMKKFGESEYGGVSKSNIETTSERSPAGKTADQLEKEGVICIGINGGKFDEHPFDGAAPLPRHCAATLVALRLGVDDHPGLNSILDNAFARNHSARCGHFEISVLSKLAFRHLSHSGDESKDKRMTSRIFEATFFFLEAVYADGVANFIDPTDESKGKVLPGKVTWAVDLFSAKWLLRKYRPSENLSVDTFILSARKSGKSVSDTVANFLGIEDDSNLEWILKYARDHREITQRKASDRLEIPNFELWYLVELAQRVLCHGDNARNARFDISKAVNLFLDAVYAKDKGFADCIKDYESKDTRTHIIKPKGSKKQVVITSVVSANPEMPKFCRSQLGKYTAVGIKQDPNTKNILIFFDKKQGVNPLPIVVAIRRAERFKKNLPDNLSQATLEEQGSIPGAENWYFDGNQMMNGSLTSYAEPTEISRERLETFVYSAVKNQFPDR